MKYLYVSTLFIFLSFNLNGQTLIGQELFGQFANARFGFPIDISADGQVLAVGNSNGTASDEIRIYHLINNIWVQVGNPIIDTNPVTAFGFEIALDDDGDTIVVGIPNATNNTGKVEVYENQGGNWVQKGQDLDGEAQNNSFGRSLDINSDGSTIVIGAPSNDDNGGNSGHTRIYNYETNSWVQVGQDIDGEFQFDQSGWAVAISGDGSIVASGAPGSMDEGNAGHMRVFEDQNDSWVQLGSDINGDFFDSAGWDIAMNSDGTILAMGSPSNSDTADFAGKIEVFQNTAGAWVQLGQDIYGSAADESIGENIALSGNGNVLAIGLPRESDNGMLSGKVKIYQNQNDNWVEVGSILGEFGLQFLGNSIALNSDGTVLAVGADGRGINSDEPGSARVYDISNLLSVNDFETIKFSLYPNPAKDQFTIQLKNRSDLQRINIYNSLGQSVLSTKETVIDTSLLASGLYTVEITTTKGKGIKKLIIR